MKTALKIDFEASRVEFKIHILPYFHILVHIPYGHIFVHITLILVHIFRIIPIFRGKMPKNHSKSVLIKEWIKKIDGTTIYTTDGKVIYCKACQQQVI